MSLPQPTLGHRVVVLHDGAHELSRSQLERTLVGTVLQKEGLDFVQIPCGMTTCYTLEAFNARMRCIQAYMQRCTPLLFVSLGPLITSVMLNGFVVGNPLGTPNNLVGIGDDGMVCITPFRTDDRCGAFLRVRLTLLGYEQLCLVACLKPGILQNTRLCDVLARGVLDYLGTVELQDPKPLPMQLPCVDEGFADPPPLEADTRADASVLTKGMLVDAAFDGRNVWLVFAHEGGVRSRACVHDYRPSVLLDAPPVTQVELRAALGDAVQMSCFMEPRRLFCTGGGTRDVLRVQCKMEHWRGVQRWARARKLLDRHTEPHHQLLLHLAWKMGDMVDLSVVAQSAWKATGASPPYHVDLDAYTTLTCINKLSAEETPVFVPRALSVCISCVGYPTHAIQAVVVRDEQTARTTCFSLGRCDHPEAREYYTQHAMLRDFLQYLHNRDPDALVFPQQASQTLVALWERAQACGLAEHWVFGRLPHPMRMSTDYAFAIPKFVMQARWGVSTSVEFASLTGRAFMPSEAPATPAARGDVVRACIGVVDQLHEAALGKGQLIETAWCAARLIGCAGPSEIPDLTQAARFELLLKNTQGGGEFAFPQDATPAHIANRGGWHHDARVGYVRDAVDVDMSAFYPKIICTWNLSPECCRFEGEQTFVNGASQPDGLLTRAVKEVLAVRERARAHGDYALSQAAKLFVNVMTGILQRDYKPVGAQMTFLGRELIMRLCSLLCEQWGCSVAYGNTDGLILQGAPRNRNLEAEIQELVRTKLLHNTDVRIDMNIRLEGIHPHVLFKPGGYIVKGEDGSLDTRGTVLDRADAPQLAKDTYRQIVHTTFQYHQGTLSADTWRLRVAAILRDAVHTLLSPDTPISQLTVGYETKDPGRRAKSGAPGSGLRGPVNTVQSLLRRSLVMKESVRVPDVAQLCHCVHVLQDDNKSSRLLRSPEDVEFAQINARKYWETHLWHPLTQLVSYTPLVDYLTLVLSEVPAVLSPAPHSVRVLGDLICICLWCKRVIQEKGCCQCKFTTLRASWLTWNDRKSKRRRPDEQEARSVAVKRKAACAPGSDACEEGDEDEDDANPEEDMQTNA